MFFQTFICRILLNGNGTATKKIPDSSALLNVIVYHMVKKQCTKILIWYYNHLFGRKDFSESVLLTSFHSGYSMQVRNNFLYETPLKYLEL